MEEETDKELILEEFLPYKLAILSHTVSRLVARVYDKSLGLTIPEWRVILIVGRFPGLSAVEVAERTMLDKVAVSRAVTKLIKSGQMVDSWLDWCGAGNRCWPRRCETMTSVWGICNAGQR